MSARAQNATVDISSEKALLGACLMHEAVFWDVADKLRPDDFGVGRHQRIWEALQSLAADGKSITARGVPAYIKNDANEEIGVAAYLAVLADEAPPPGIAREFADTIIHFAARRRIIEAGDKIKALALAADAGTPIDDILDASISAVTNSLGNAGDGDRMRSIGDWGDDLMRRVAKNLTSVHENPLGYSTGIRAVDEVIGRILPEKLYVVAALSSVGKSALLRQIMKACAETEVARARTEGKQPKWGYIASLEMTGREHAAREMAEMTGISAGRIEEAEMNEAEYDAMLTALARLRQLPIMVDEKPRLTMDDIRSRMLQVKRRKGGLAFAAIDHLLLIKGGKGKRDDLFDRIADATIEAKNLAKEFEIPVFVLSQLKDSVWERPSGKPTNADVFGGRSIEQNADVILFIHRPEIITKAREPSKDAIEKHASWALKLESEKGKAVVFNGKRRGGSRGETRELLFEGSTMTFRDIY